MSPALSKAIRMAVGAPLLLLAAGCSESTPASHVTTCVPASSYMGKILTFEIDFTTPEPSTPERVQFRQWGGAQVIGRFVVTAPDAISSLGHIGVQPWDEDALGAYRLAPMGSHLMHSSTTHHVVLQVEVTGGDGWISAPRLWVRNPSGTFAGQNSLNIAAHC